MASPLSHLLHADPIPLRHPGSSSQQQNTSTFHPGGGAPLLPSQLPIPTPQPPASSTSAPVPAPAPASAHGAPPSAPPDPSGNHQSSPNLYQCASCGRRYSRPEHLQRHIATHTLGKRFACDVCGKAFSRADLLKRHRANHDDSENGSKRRRINSSPGAGRVAHACQACAKARVKCEEVKPCTRCRNRNLNCEYTSTEAGSAAAMHLLHLANGPSSSGIPDEDPAAISPQSYQHSPHVEQPRQPHPLPPPADSVPLKTSASPNFPYSLPTHLDGSQLSTPETMDHSNAESYASSYPNHAMVDMAKMPFSDFLRDVLYEQSLDPAKAEESQGISVLDFCDDTNLELNDMDLGILDHWNVDDTFDRSPNPQSMIVPKPEESVDLSQMRQRLVKIWTESPWRWQPTKLDSAYGEQGNLPVSSKELMSAKFQESQKRPDRVVKDKLEPSGRDKVLAIVLSTCRSNTMMNRVASSFVSTELMESLINIFLASHLCQVSSWIHYGSFKLNAQHPEWLAVAACAGAMLAPSSTLRKFGLALQESVRLTIQTRFEDNSNNIQNIGLVQALVLGQDIGLWSGNRRTMEIASCHLQIPLSMMRGRGIFQRSRAIYAPIIVDPADEGTTLEAKWRKWSEREAWKRLVFHTYLRDAQTSMTRLTNPAVSYAELTLPLPESRELWFAGSAEEWKMHYLEKSVGQSRKPPSLIDLLRDTTVLSANYYRLDVQLAISVYLHGCWAMIWEHRQLDAIHCSGMASMAGGSPQDIFLGSRHQELCKQLEQFQALTAEWHAVMSAQECLVLHILMMNLHVSLDDLQLFSGKEGEDQARCIYPSLQRWADGPDARRALWHAGQVMRYGKLFPPGHLKDFYAVALHHAALALWTYGVVTKATRRRAGALGQEVVVYLDKPDQGQVPAYIGYGQGRPAIRAPGSQDREGTQGLLEDPRSCMDVAQEILRANFVDEQDAMPPICENLVHLLKQLGNAAWAVGLG